MAVFDYGVAIAEWLQSQLAAANGLVSLVCCLVLPLDYHTPLGGLR